MVAKTVVLQFGGLSAGLEVSHLVTMIVEGEDSWMFQIPGTQLVSIRPNFVDAVVACSNSG